MPGVRGQHAPRARSDRLLVRQRLHAVCTVALSFENKEEFESHFPANFISEAVDQTRGWFYTLLAIGTLIFDKAPFENCIVSLDTCRTRTGRR